MQIRNIIQNQKIRFFVVGIANTIIDFIFYSILNLFISNIAAVGIISGGLALICALITHNFLTFKQNAPTKTVIFKFIASTGFGLWIIRPALLTLFSAYNENTFRSFLHFIHLNDILSELFIKQTVAFGLTAIFIMVYNYLIYSRFVFLSNQKKKP